MKPRTRNIAVLGSLAIVAALAWTLRGDSDRDEEPLRLAPPIPSPTDAQRVEYFFSMIARGEQVRLRGQMLPAWSLVAFPALRELGSAAADYLLAEERTAMYRRSPSILSNVMRLLPTISEAKEHPRYYPFLLSWVSPSAFGDHADAEKWAVDMRLHVFNALRSAPHESAVDLCLDELSRTKRTNDIRALAIDLLFSVGRADALVERAATLPPAPGQPEEPTEDGKTPPDLRIHLLTRLMGLAVETQSPERRDQVRLFDGFLTGALESSRPQDRLAAALALKRLGPAERSESARQQLIREYTRYRKQGGDIGQLVFTTALQYLAEDGPDPFVKEQCLALAEEPGPTLGYLTALRLLARHWVAEDAVRDLLWDAIDRHEFVRFELVASRLVDADRARAARYLEDELRSRSASRRQIALKIVQALHVTEVIPALLEIVREEPARSRPPLYAALVGLDATRVVPLLVAEMAPNRPGIMHSVAAAELMALGERLDVVAKAIREGNPDALGALRIRIRGHGMYGIPDKLLPAVLDAIRTLPGEEERRELILALRMRGELDRPTREGLIRAYRHEPSRLVARDLKQALIELAHRRSVG